jgi:hypothetical protein
MIIWSDGEKIERRGSIIVWERVSSSGFPGISCLDFGELSRVATLTSSLRDFFLRTLNLHRKLRVGFRNMTDRVSRFRCCE